MENPYPKISKAMRLEWCDEGDDIVYYEFIDNPGANNLYLKTWDLFGAVWEWATKQEWWVKFVKHYDFNYTYAATYMRLVRLTRELITPTRFLNALEDFLA
ncbi:MAG: hypothetical protein ACXABY_14345 [Candidatus Thorarchaeota archaeon]|jgi:hypothetical protein